MSDRLGGAVVQDSETSVHRSITVDVGREHAFEVFTAGFDTWWIRSHHIGEAELDRAIIEPRAGGRWYERGVDGSECNWGHVIAWEPPARLVLAWQINGQWTYDPDLLTEVEITFTAEGPSRTRVDVEHRNLDRFGPDSAEMRAAFQSDSGWSGLLAAYLEATTSP